MTLELSFWQQVLLLGLAGLSLIYVFYFRIWLAVAIGSDLLFACALGLTLAAIVTPDPFSEAAEALVDRSPLPAALARADARVAEIEALPQTLIRRALARIGYEPEADEVPAAQLEALPVPGPFVSSVRPSVEALVATVVRFSSFVCGSFLMLTSLAMRSSTTTARKLREQGRRLESLEAQLARSNSPSQPKAGRAEMPEPR